MQRQVEILLTQPQEDFVFSPAQFPLFVGGFGSGKSQALAVRILLQALQSGLNQGYFAPTYDLLRLIAFPRFSELLDSWGLPHRLLTTDGMLHLPNGAQIIFRTMETPERIVGFEIADAAVDELDTLRADHAEAAWNKIIARCRLRKPGGAANTAAVGTTPEGFRFVHKRWVQQQAPGYEIIRAPTSSNPFLPPAYIESLKATYPPQLLAAYLDGQFVNLTSGTVYNSYDRERCASAEEIKAGEPLFIGQDFNVGSMASTVYVIRPNGWHAVEELTGIYDTPALCKTLRERYIAENHRVTVYPDASGGGRKTVDAAKSDIALLREVGCAIRAHPSNPAVKDRVAAVNRAFSDGKLWVNWRKCLTVASSLEQQSYDKNGDPDKSGGQDHQNDATGYPVAFEMPVVRPASAIFAKSAR